MNNKNKQEKIIDDIVSMIDQFMASGGGHMNVDVNSDINDITIKQMRQSNCTDCNSKNMACQIPTPESAIDREEE